MLMRYKKSKQFRNAKPENYKQFVGLKSKKYEGKSFVIDEHDAKMISANIPKKDYSKFKKEFQSNTYSSFRVLQDFERNKKKMKDVC